MRIVQATFGVFHQFELAREMLERGHLERIYSTFPWRRLEREGIPHDKVETFPWVHMAQMLLWRTTTLPPRMDSFISLENGRLFDRWVTRRMPECDVAIAISGAGLECGRLAQRRGGKFICDRGSTHRAYQAEIVEEEHRIWRQPWLQDEQRAMPWELEIYAQADAITVPSQASRRTFLERGVSPEKVHVIPYGVRLERFSKVADPPSGPSARFEVLFVGGISLRKGIPYLLQAFAALRHPHKRLRIVGEVMPQMKALIASLPQEHVEWLGALPQSELPAIMSSSHVMVLASIEDGFGLVVPQAMACGCVTICSANAGAADIITHGLDGFIAPSRESGAIAERLQQLAEDRSMREQMSERALARVRLLGGWRRYGDQWEELLQGLIQS